MNKSITLPKLKQSFMLNGEELPLPSDEHLYPLSISGYDATRFYFSTKEERDMVEQAINKLLTDATP